MDTEETAEPDEFARLLAQLNGTPVPEPAAPAMPAPSPAQPPFSAPAPAPVAPAPVAPAPVAPAPVAPAPVTSAPVTSAPVAPAFGLATPYPPRAGMPPAPVSAPPATLSFPTVAPAPVAPAPVAPEAPPLPRAPELIGADELAAPPRPFPPLSETLPPLSETLPPLVSPPSYSAPPDLAAGLPTQQAPSFEPPGSAPVVPVAQPSMAAAPAPSAPALFAPTAHAPRDFASLLATPVDAGDDSSSATAALRFGSSGPDDDDDEPDLARSTTSEKIGLVLAILVAPIGLIAGIIAAARSASRRGWVVGIVRVSIAIAAVLTVVLGVLGYYGYTQLKVQQAHDQTAAASAAFCATIKANPTMDQLPTFGWPAVASSIPDSLKAMQAYEDRWTKLAKVSPAGIKPGVTRVADAAKKIVDSVTSSRVVDDASNVAVMSSTASSSGVQSWYSEYCR